MKPETLLFLRELVCQQIFSANDPDFRTRVTKTLDVLDDIDTAMYSSVTAYPNPAESPKSDGSASIFDQTHTSVYGGTP